MITQLTHVKKGEQAVITACEKEFGDKSVPYAEKMIGRLLGGKDEMERN